MGTPPSPPRVAAAALRGLCGGAVHLPGDPGYDAARMPWNIAVAQQPAAVAVPATPHDVAQVVRAAAAAGLRVAPQGTGHNAGPLSDLSGVVLLRTTAMTGVAIDAVAGEARVQPGTLWDDVAVAAAAHGHSVLHGSAPDVGVLGFSLGGGMGWYARDLGLQCNAITGAQVVTADGEIVRVDADSEPDLFWALRGGGGSFGVVTELRFRTFAFATAYAGVLAWDWRRAAEVLPVWAVWAQSAPDCVTTSFRLMQLPPVDDVPAAFRGRQLAVIDGAVRAPDGDAAEVLAALRALRPDVDTFTRVPTSQLTRLHMDPEGPTPAVSATAVLGELPQPGIDALLAAAGPGSGSTLIFAELRQLGGALSRPAPGAGALPSIDGAFLLFALGLGGTADMESRSEADAQRVVAALQPWANGRYLLNFAEQQIDTAAGYAPQEWRRLQAVRSDVDPGGLFLANHRIPPLRAPS